MPQAMATPTTSAPSMSRRTPRSPADRRGRSGGPPAAHGGGGGGGGGPAGGPGNRVAGPDPAMTPVRSEPVGRAADGGIRVVVAEASGPPAARVAAVTVTPGGSAAAGIAGPATGATAAARTVGPMSVVTRRSVGAGSGSAVPARRSRAGRGRPRRRGA